MRALLGCSGWSYQDWRGPFYPESCDGSEFLERYSQVFGLAEVDSTFYGPPTRQTTRRWVTETPQGFVFAPKVPGLITHAKGLRDVEADLEVFLDGIEPLASGGRLGPILLQFPQSFTSPQGLDVLEGFLTRWPAVLRLAVEFRDASWWTPSTFDMLGRHRAALVWSVTQYGEAPLVRTTDFLYVRFVGDRQLTRFDRVQRDLRPVIERWKPHILDRSDQREAYVVVNNHFMGFAPSTARVTAEVLGLPLPDLQRARRRRHQSGLTGV